MTQKNSENLQLLLIAVVAIAVVATLFWGMASTQPADVFRKIEQMEEELRNSTKPEDVFKKVEEVEAEVKELRGEVRVLKDFIREHR